MGEVTTAISDSKTAQANLDVFSATLQELAATNRNLLVVTSDSRGSGKLVPFAQKYLKQLIEIGIAEQNLVGVAAGLASTGKNVFAVSPACFLTARSFEQIKTDVCYSNNPVRLIGISAGVSYGALGSTHHSLHDFAALRAVHNLTIVAPADNFETERAIRQAAQLDTPIYIRFGKKPMPLLSEENREFVFGKGRVVNQGDDLVLVATGETVYPALLGAHRLERTHGIRSTVVSMHTIKPLDYDLLGTVAAKGCPIVTAEEHSVYGGLGEACASFLLTKGFRNRFSIMGIPDEYTVTGSQTEIFNHYGLSEEGIAQEALTLINS